MQDRSSIDGPAAAGPPSLGVYVHLPFCTQKCTYCAFAISTRHSLEDSYIQALIREVESCGLRGSAIDSLYFGGGTPSKTSRENLETVFDALLDQFEFGTDLEVTLEANPEDVDEDHLAFWQALGVTRVSIGVQSLDDSELVPLGRLHGRTTALTALRQAVDAGFRTNADLILGLPGQSRASAAASLEGIVETGITHLSVYMLDLEPGSALEQRVNSGLVVLPEEDATAAMYLETIEWARVHGFQQYEISNFAVPGHESRHNLRYWRREPYRGFGLGAHSFLGGSRFANTRDIGEYISRASKCGDAVTMREELTETEIHHERLFLALRQEGGLEYAELVQIASAEVEEWVSRGVEQGWMRQSGSRVALTPAGFLVSNELISQLF